MTVSDAPVAAAPGRPLPAREELADCIVVEDTAIVVDEIAVMMSMAPARGGRSARDRGGSSRVPHDRTREAAGADNGGDVVRSGHASSWGYRSDGRGRRRRTARLPAPFGYSVTAVPVLGCLHLKSACSAPRRKSLVNRPSLSLTDSRTSSYRSEGRTAAGDVVTGERIIASDAFPETTSWVAGLEVIPVSVSEFAKAEGGVTCMSPSSTPASIDGRSAATHFLPAFGPFPALGRVHFSASSASMMPNGTLSAAIKTATRSDRKS